MQGYLEKGETGKVCARGEGGPWTDDGDLSADIVHPFMPEERLALYSEEERVRMKDMERLRTICRERHCMQIAHPMIVVADDISMLQW